MTEGLGVFMQENEIEAPLPRLRGAIQCQRASEHQGVHQGTEQCIHAGSRGTIASRVRYCTLAERNEHQDVYQDAKLLTLCDPTYSDQKSNDDDPIKRLERACSRSSITMLHACRTAPNIVQFGHKT